MALRRVLCRDCKQRLSKLRFHVTQTNKMPKTEAFSKLAVFFYKHLNPFWDVNSDGLGISAAEFINHIELFSTNNTPSRRALQLHRLMDAFNDNMKYGQTVVLSGYPLVATAVRMLPDPYVRQFIDLLQDAVDEAIFF